MTILTDIHAELTNHPAFVHVEEHKDICFNEQAHSYTYINKDMLVFDLWVELYHTDELLVTARYGDDLEGTELVRPYNLNTVVNTIADMCDI